jgi:drug/metabolite transporter (DMT)-like permease
MFVANGGCTVIQKIQQIAFVGEYKNEFMILALAFVVAFLLILTLVKEHKDIKLYAKCGWHAGLACGVANGAVNLFVLMLTNMTSVSLMFPLISAGGVIVTYLVSRFLYKEKLTRAQFIGFIIGTISVVFLNL